MVSVVESMRSVIRRVSFKFTEFIPSSVEGNEIKGYQKSVLWLLFSSFFWLNEGMKLVENRTKIAEGELAAKLVVEKTYEKILRAVYLIGLWNY